MPIVQNNAGRLTSSSSRYQFPPILHHGTVTQTSKSYITQHLVLSNVSYSFIEGLSTVREEYKLDMR